jgi:hypothetical protein
MEIIADEGSCSFFEIPAAAVVGGLVPDRQGIVEIGNVTGDGYLGSGLMGENAMRNPTNCSTSS